MARTRLQHLPAEVGTGSEAGQPRLQYPVEKAKTGDGLYRVGVEQPLECKRAVADNRPSQGAKRVHQLSCGPTGEYESWNRASSLG